MEHQHDPSSSAARKFDDDHTDPDCIDDFFHQTTIELVSPRKLIVAIFFLAFSWIFSSYTITLADERSPDPNQYRPLPDIFIDNVTRIPWAATVSEVIIVAFGILFLLLVTFHRYRTLIVVRCCVILSTLYLFRAMTIWVTSMPVVGSHLNCRSVKPNTLTGRIERAAHVLISQGLDIYGSDMCGDYIFSGHTCMLVILAHFITEYVSDNCVLFRLLVWFTCGSGVVCILAAHFHYTVDVVLAVVIASRLFVYYHSLCQCPVMFESSIRQRFIYQIPLFYFAENESTCELRSRVRGAVQIPPSFVSAIGRLRRQFGFGQRVGMSSARRKRVATGDANAGGGGGIGANSHHLRLRRNDDSNETVSLICPQSTRIAAAVNIEAEEDDEAMARRNSVVLVIENDEL